MQSALGRPARLSTSTSFLSTLFRCSTGSLGGVGSVTTIAISSFGRTWLQPPQPAWLWAPAETVVAPLPSDTELCVVIVADAPALTMRRCGFLSLYRHAPFMGASASDKRLALGPAAGQSYLTTSRSQLV